MLMPHTLEDCPQNPTLAQIQSTLKRLDAHGERTAVALESIAAQGAILGSHEKRLDKHDVDFREMFSRINDERKLDKLAADVESVAARVVALEKDHAKEAGAEAVEALALDAAREKTKFWTEFKIRMITPVMLATVILLWLIGKWELVQRVAAIVREFRELFGG